MNEPALKIFPFHPPRNRAAVRARLSLAPTAPAARRIKLISGVPSPGLPDAYPHYLKPIPVNQRDIEAALHAALKSEAPKLEKFLYSTWTAQADAIKYQELRNAIRDGDMSEAWFEQWRKDYTDFVNNSWGPAVLRSMEASGNLMITGVDAPAGSFQLGTENIISWMNAHGGDLITGFVDTQKTAVQNILNWSINQNIGTEEAARYLRAVVGLNAQQSLAVEAYRLELTEAGKLTPEQITHQVENYAARLERRRAATIAHTEVANAYNRGGLESMRQMTGPGGWMEGETIIKTWRTAPGCCSDCADMEGEQVEVNQLFSNGFDAPGLHPTCYCILEYFRLKAGEELMNIARGVALLKKLAAWPTGAGRSPARRRH